MNARILRKWSIHTKNLMSCSVCSIVVVVLLLLITCAPSQILATMNFRSDASFAARPTHMPNNIIKEATLSATASGPTSSLFSPSSSSSSLTLPNRHQRLASPRGAVVEFAKTPDINRELFPGYYKNLHADDIHQISQLPGYRSTSNSDGSDIDIESRGLMSSSSSRSSSSSSSSSISRNRLIDNTHQHQPLHSNSNSNSDSDSNSNTNNDNLGYMLQLRGWPRHHITSSSNDGGIKRTPYVDEAMYINDDTGDNDENAAEKKIVYTTNGNNPPQLPHTITSVNFPMQQTQFHNHRRMGALPSPLFQHLPTTSSAAPALSYQQKQPELIHSKNIHKPKNETNNFKSVPEEKNHYITATNNTNVNKIKSSDLPLRFIIESYEVPASLPLAKELTDQQRRMLIHEQHQRQLRTMQQQAARSRRDSLRGRYKSDLLTSSSLSYRQFSAAQHKNDNNNSKNNKNLRQQHHHQHQHRQRMHKHSHRYCSARDPAQLAFEAPTVFEGKIVSMTPDRRQNFSATVEVRQVFKQQIGYRLQKYLRLQFAYRNNSGECDIYREQLRPRGLVRGDTIEPGRIYLLFVQQIDIGNFTILGQPIRKTKRVVETVRYAVSGNYAQLASIKSISASNRTVENGQELRIVCRVTGQPPPKVTWFKDHRSINRNRKLYQFSHYKKRSELIIRSFNTSDAGRYECRAKNKVNRNIERRAIVIKAYPVQRFDPNPRGTGNNCPDDASEFCFNGGTCKFFSEIGSYSCICPEGFIGERCDRKEVNNMPPSTYSNEHECGENKYLGSYYC